LGAAYQSDTYYLLLSAIKPSRAIAGFMPLKRQFGFIFSPPLGVGGLGLRTMAHELGHGVFGLQHPFTQYNTTATTNLLMDYGSGTELSHNDWEILHAPGLQLYQFTQGSSAGELTVTDEDATMIGMKTYDPGSKTIPKNNDQQTFYRGGFIISFKEGVKATMLPNGNFKIVYNETSDVYTVMLT
jgi:hypothetical protein